MKTIILLLAILAYLSPNIYAQAIEKSENIRKYIELNAGSMSPIGQESISCKQLIPEYYLEHQFVPIWNNIENANQLIKSIKSAYEEGLNPEDYHFKYLSESLSKSEEITAELDVLLSDAYFLLATHLP